MLDTVLITYCTIRFPIFQNIPTQITLSFELHSLELLKEQTGKLG